MFGLHFRCFAEKAAPTTTATHTLLSSVYLSSFNRFRKNIKTMRITIDQFRCVFWTQIKKTRTKSKALFYSFFAFLFSDLEKQQTPNSQLQSVCFHYFRCILSMNWISFAFVFLFLILLSKVQTHRPLWWLSALRVNWSWRFVSIAEALPIKPYVSVIIYALRCNPNQWQLTHLCANLLFVSVIAISPISSMLPIK